MKKDDKKTVQVRILNETASGISKLSKKFDKYGYEIVDSAIKYFLKTGYNPAEMHTIETPAEEMKKLRNSIVFFKKDVSEQLSPLVNLLDSVSMSLVEFLKKPDLSTRNQPELSAAINTQAKNPPLKNAGLFALPDSAMEDEIGAKPIGDLSNVETIISMEKKQNEIDFLRTTISDCLKKMVRKGDGYNLTISKIEFSQLQELSNAH